MAAGDSALQPPIYAQEISQKVQDVEFIPIPKSEPPNSKQVEPTAIPDGIGNDPIHETSERGPKAPRVPTSSYEYYSNAIRPKLMQENPRIRNIDHEQVTRERWKALSPEQKKTYEDMAASDKVRWHMEYHQYNAHLAAAGLPQNIHHQIQQSQQEKKKCEQEQHQLPQQTQQQQQSNTREQPITDDQRVKIRPPGQPKRKKTTETATARIMTSTSTATTTTTMTTTTNKEPPKKRRRTLVDHRKNRRRLFAERDSGMMMGRNGADGILKVERIIGMRDCCVEVEYLVRWKGLDPSLDTWEPESSLSDAAMQQAKAFRREEEIRRKRLREGAVLLGVESERFSKVDDVYVVPGHFSCSATIDDVYIVPGHFSCSTTISETTKQNYFTPIKVNDKSVPRNRIGSENNPPQIDDTGKDQRSSSLTATRDKPISVQATKEDMDFFQISLDHEVELRELQRIHVHDRDAKAKVTEARISGTPIVLVGQQGWPQFANRWLRRTQRLPNNELLDLSQSHELDIERMIEDIGDESVPILEKNYDERKPIVKETFASTFLRRCWPQNGKPPAIKGLYLHQWQFPMSETAASKLCGQGNCATLPNDIFHEDLLQYWLDKKDNPFQYIFMGDEGTFSKLHKDNGGLEITIAPIVGQKECVLVHRLDGADCLYHFKSKLDNIDLDKFPMTSFARVWRTVVQPGEMLLMPSGTYHQCRNVTPCLSYHTFHLDTLNLQPFLKSMLEGDAPEIDHDDVIWNCTIEFIERVERYIEKYRTMPEEPVPEKIIKTVKTLRQLRPVCREIANSFDFYGRQTLIRPKNPIFLKKLQDAASHYWSQIVQDIDLTLHEFNHRHLQKGPKFCQHTVNVLENSTEANPETIAKSLAELEDTTSKKNSTASSDTKGLERVIQKLSPLQPFQEDVVIPDSVELQVGDEVLFRLCGKQGGGRIIKIVEQMKAVYVTYNELPSCFDEYQPKDKVQTDNIGDIGSRQTQKQTGICSVGGKGKAQNATVRYTKCATFYLVRLKSRVGRAKIERWLCRDSFISKGN